MRVIKTIETEIYEPIKGTNRVKFTGMITAEQAFDQLYKHLEQVGLLPDEYFSLFFQAREKTLPQFHTAVCSANWGGSEGIYVDIDLIYVENQQSKTFHLATGKTLERNGDAFMKMSRIAAECSMMLNGHGSLVKVSERNYENYIEKPSLDDRIGNIKDKQGKTESTNHQRNISDIERDNYG